MISQRCRYALKAMLNLARETSGRPKQVSVLAAEEKIPRKFLEGIMSELRQHELVISSRGKMGGYSLSRPAELITIGDVMRRVEGPISLLNCVSTHFYKRCADCPDEKACELRRVMLRVRREASDILDRTTLADALAVPVLGVL